MDTAKKLYNEIREIHMRLLTESMSSEEVAVLQNKKDILFAYLLGLEDPATEAEFHADFFGNDGRCFQIDEANLEEICEKHAKRIDRRDGGSVRYTFKDNSVITVHGDGWDLGFADCWCWEENPDTDNCSKHAR